jgi:hypothetical protein
MQTKTVSLEDILPQLPINKIRKVSGNWFNYFQLGSNLVIGNGHIFFVIGLEYLEAVSNYAKQLQKEILPGQIEIAEFRCIPDNVQSVDGWLGQISYSDSTIFNHELYNPDYLKIIASLTPYNPVKTVLLNSRVWDSQLSVWKLPNSQITVLLAGILKHK